MSTIGERVRSTRTKLKMSRSALAKVTGMAYSTLSDIELGRTTSTFSLHKLASALRVNPTWLETGRGSADLLTDVASITPQSPGLQPASQSTDLVGDRLASAYAAVCWRYLTAGEQYELERDPMPLVLAYRFAGDPSEDNRIALTTALEERLSPNKANERTEHPPNRVNAQRTNKRRR